MKTRASKSALTAAALMLAGTASAANLVSNPDFDSDVAGWSATGANMAIAWSGALNVVGASGSGSALITNSGPAGFNAGVIQCVASGVVGGASYDVGAWVHYASGQAGAGTAGLFALYFDQPNCTGTQIGTVYANPYLPPPLDAWTLISTTAVAPAGAASVWIYLNLPKDNANGNPFSASFDGVRFGPTPTTPVTLQSFDVD